LAQPDVRPDRTRLGDPGLARLFAALANDVGGRLLNRCRDLGLVEVDITAETKVLTIGTPTALTRRDPDADDAPTGFFPLGTMIEQPAGHNMIDCGMAPWPAGSWWTSRTRPGGIGCSARSPCLPSAIADPTGTAATPLPQGAESGVLAGQWWFSIAVRHDADDQ